MNRQQSGQDLGTDLYEVWRAAARTAALAAEAERAAWMACVAEGRRPADHRSREITMAGMRTR